jgi:hypothetical protein
MKKTILAAAILSATMFTASCQGPNKLFNDLNDWNAELTEQDWVNTGVFWLGHIIPVYEIAYLIDIVVLNTVEYWGEED